MSQLSPLFAILPLALTLQGCWLEDLIYPPDDKPVDTAIPCEPEDEIPYDGIDQDCDGEDITDWDEDGYIAVEAGGDDCDDLHADVHPGAEEIYYDGTDQDCDGLSDYDADLDGYDSDAYDGDDCDDDDETVNPSADELCDELDRNCDGDPIADAVDAPLWYPDLDLDGFGDEQAEAVASCDELSGLVDVGGDCDDADGTVNPDADEIFYDGIDQDCDGLSDYDAYYDGHDSDAYAGTDCDDTDAGVNPDVVEIFYDGLDANCDGASDYDADADGYDVDAHGGSDCDDSEAAIHAGAADTW